MHQPGREHGACVILIAALVAACGGPAKPSPVPRSLTVTAAVTGTQYQLFAVAGFSDGSTQDVTSQAGWRSSDSTVASVSAAGLVTPLANGSALITAIYQGVTGSLALSVVAPSAPPSSPPPSPPPGPAPQTYTLAGVVRATPLDETVAGVGIEAMHGGRVVASTTTDGGGFYALTGLIAQEYVLRLRKVGYYARTIDVLVTADTTRDLVMDRNRVTLTGIAREPAPCLGGPLNSALVQILDGPDAGKSSLTDRSGSQYAIADVSWGAFRVRVSKDGYGTSEMTLTVPATDIINGPFTQNFDLRRTSTQTLSGEVRERRTESGARMAGVRVEVVTGPDAGRATISDSLGRYRLEQLAAADVTVRATLPGFFDELVTTPLCGDRQLEIGLTPTNARLEGTVLDSTAALTPLEGAIVEIVSGTGAGQTAVTDAGGRYSFTGLYGTLTVRASKAGYTSENHTFTVRDPISFWNFGLRRP
ncbi:MAG TPA: carboxypeptidase regulatory-like domain-containing protein [Vicinamibacterales bacterium]